MKLAAIVFLGAMAITQSFSSHSSVKLATGDNYLPFASHQMPQGGWSAAIVMAVFESMDKPVDVEVLPWDRSLMWTEQGRYVGAFPFVKSDQREAVFFYSEPINFIPIYFYAAQGLDVQKLDDLQGKRLCLPYGYSNSTAGDGLSTVLNLKINRVKDSQSCLTHVHKGWSDIGLTNKFVGIVKSSERAELRPPLKLIPFELGQEALYFIVSRSLPNAEQIIQDFNEHLHTLTQTGDRYKIDQQFIQLMRQREADADETP